MRALDAARIAAIIIPMPATIPSLPLTRYRSKPATSSLPPGKINPNGGAYGAGLISGVSIVAGGEAEGHGQWIDSEFLSQVAAAINASPGGVKSRFAHPSLSGDGLGTALGRARNAKVDGDRVIADLHLLESAQETPDGDLASYVMGLAGEDAQLFGVSIAFVRDKNAESAFHSSRLDADGKFRSPDEKNTRNLPHVRLKRLTAADVVDEPAANPSGLFSGGQVSVEWENAVLYVLGQGDRPQSWSAAESGLDLDRARMFVSRILDAKGISMAVETPTPTPTAAVTKQAESPSPTIEQLEEAMPGAPAELVLLAAKSKDTIEQALRRYNAHLVAAQKQASDAIAALSASPPTGAVRAVSRGAAAQPAGFASPPATSDPLNLETTDDESIKAAWESIDPPLRKSFGSVGAYKAFILNRHKIKGVA